MISRRTVEPIQSLAHYRSWGLSGVPDCQIDKIWVSQSHTTASLRHRLLPHLEPSLAIRRRFDTSGAIADIELVVCGGHQAYQWYEPHPREQLLALRIRPETAKRCFGVAPEDYLDAVPLRAPAAIRDSCSKSLLLAEYASSGDVLTQLFLDVARFSPRAKSSDMLSTAAQLLRSSEGKISIGTLANRADMSERHFRRILKSSLGICPKRYAKQLRLVKAATDAERVEQPAWAELAIGAGYHDQAHMSRDFKEILGISPGVFHAERREMSDFYNTMP